MPERERFGDFLLHERLAVGGMGELYLATRAERRGPPFALKIMARSYREHPEFVSMFQDEARIGMRLSHSNIVGVHEVGVAEQTSFIVMEYVHGENLRSVLRALDRIEERIPPPFAVKLVIDVLRGLDHAHNATDETGAPLQLVHRDLSPDNILVSYEGQVKLLDFGIAKAEGRTTTTQVGVVKGKPQYMSPEQAHAWPVDARSDVFSAAVVLVEMLTGERRFADDEARWESARKWKPKPVTPRVPGLPAELDAVLLHALDPDPAKRFQTAEEFASELTRIARSGGLPRSKESLPALLKRLFPEASAKKFDSSDVTLFQPPSFAVNGAGAEIDATDTRPAVNLATLTAPAADARTTPGVRRLDGPIDDDDTRPAADLATLASPAPAGVLTATGAARLDDDRTAPGVWRLDANRASPGARRDLRDEEHPTTPSYVPRHRRRQVMGALAAGLLVPLGAAGGFAIWRFWRNPGEPRPKPAPAPAAKKRATPRPTPRRAPTPARKKKTPPRRR